MSKSCMSYMLLFAFSSLVITGTSCDKHNHEGNHEFISKPLGVRWHILGDSLILSWLYSENAKPPDGFYVKLQEYKWDGTLGIPDFVHVKHPESMSVDIHGLKPGTKYHVKVIAYSDEGSKASRGIEISTQNLEFLKVNNFEASGITDTCAIFSWSHDITNLINDMQFKITCDGESRYHENGHEKTERFRIEYMTRTTVLQNEKYKVTDLLPNSVYVCSIKAIANGGESEPRSKIEFLTLPGKPIPPPPPRVVVPSPEEPVPHYSFDVDLFDTSDINGPISHYIIYAVPVRRARNAPQSMPFIPIIPLDKLLSKAVTAHLASTVTDRLPFVLGMFDSYNLPKKLTFDGRANYLEFKPDTYYAFVTAAFTYAKDNDDVKYTLSSPSSPPVYIGPDMTTEWVKQRKPAAERFGAIIILTLIATIVTLSLLVFIIVGLAYMRRKQYGTLSFDNDSEVEIYRSSALKKGGVRIQSPRIQQTRNKKAYHILEADEAGRFQMKSPVDKIKSSKIDELEPMPELYAVTPPDSPYHPTSPLIRSRREEIHLLNNPNPNRISPKQSPRQLSPVTTPRFPSTPPTSLQRYNEYLDSSVATSVNMEDDSMAYRHPLPKRKPYTPSSTGQAQYLKTHPPGSRHPPIGPPSPPPSSKRAQEGYKAGSKGETFTEIPSSDFLLRELEEHETYIRQSYVLDKGRRVPIQRYSSMPNDELAHLDANNMIKSNSAQLADELMLVDDELFEDTSDNIYDTPN